MIWMLDHHLWRQSMTSLSWWTDITIPQGTEVHFEQWCCWCSWQIKTTIFLTIMMATISLIVFSSLVEVSDIIHVLAQARSRNSFIIISPFISIISSHNLIFDNVIKNSFTKVHLECLYLYSVKSKRMKNIMTLDTVKVVRKIKMINDTCNILIFWK